MSDHRLWLPPISHLTVQFPVHAPQSQGCPQPRPMASFQFLPHSAPAPKRRRGASPTAPLLPRLVGPEPQWPRRAVNYPVHSINDVLPQVPPHQVAALQTLSRLVASKQYSAPVLDPARAHLSVYEYQVGTQWVIWDHDTGNVLLTSLWRAAQEGSAPAVDANGAPKPAPKADIVKLLESTPKALQEGIKRVRGGFLKIQGTWVPYALCRRLARRFCYHIRFELVPLFGAGFPAECLTPGTEGYGELRYGGTAPKPARSKKTRRVRPQMISPAPISAPPATTAAPIPTATPAPASHTTALPTLSPLTPTARLAAVQLSPLQWQPARQPSPAARAAYTHAPERFGWALAAVPRQPAPATGQMSYAEMVDIVNASHCLQRLSQGTYNKMRIGNLVE